MIVNCYLKTAPSENKKVKTRIKNLFGLGLTSSENKAQIIRNFHQGVLACGDDSSLVENDAIKPCDVAVIQGWISDQTHAPHLRFRADIIKRQLGGKKYIVTADASLFQYKQKKTLNNYLRYSFNGIFRDTGIYCDYNINPQRWGKISNDYDLRLDNYKYYGRSILLLLQRDGGWSMKGLSTIEWLLNTVSRIREHSDRPIIIRRHPGDKNSRNYLNDKSSFINSLRGVTISSEGLTLEEDLKNCWAVVNHNSSAIVGPIINGYHSFVTDPHSSQCSEVCNIDFNLLETPKEFNRISWLQRISMFHWNFEELSNGDCWRHMRQFCIND